MNVDPGGKTADSETDPSKQTGLVDPPKDGQLDDPTPGNDSGAPGQDGGFVAPGQDSGSFDPGGGGGGGGGQDSGLGGGQDAGNDSGGGGVVTANNNNWVGWNDETQCPPWNPAPSAWKAPRTSGAGTHACTGLGFYAAYLGPSATASTRAAWDANFPTCKACAVSDWSDPTWGPVVRTPNGHFILNQGGCYSLVDPSRNACGLSSWEFDQCGKEACDSAGATQQAYQSCVSASTIVGASCDKAAIGDGHSDNVIFKSGSAAWAACYATGFTDNENQTTMRVLQAFCY